MYLLNICNRFLNKFGLLILIISSWALYPWAMSWFYPNAVRLIFTLWFIIILVWISFKKNILTNLKLRSAEKIIFLLWLVYLFFTLIATLISKEASLELFLRYTLKSVFFIFLFVFIDKKTLVKSFDVYSNLTTFLVCLSLLALLGIYYGVIQPTNILVTRGTSLPSNVGFVFSGFDANIRIFPTSPFFTRMQSFAIEPGACALAILPAFYWFVLFRKNLFKSIILILGIAATWSLGALITMCLIFIILFFNNSVSKSKKQILLFAILFFVSSHSLFTLFASSNFNNPIANKLKIIVPDPDDPENYNQNIGKPSVGLNMIAGERNTSFNQRKRESTKALKELVTNLKGVGFNQGSVVLKTPISVGYINVLIDSGLLGGIFYGLVILSVSWCAIKVGVGNAIFKLESDKASINTFLAASVLSSLFYGLQREQPMSSYWNMWLLACFFHEYRKINLNLKTINE